MLVLTRKYQEKIRIGNDITITILRTKGKAVRLGIEAPTDVPVIRGELSFECLEEVAEESDAESGATSSTTARRDRESMKNSWTTESHPNARKSVAQSTRVDVRRVPCEQVADVLPDLLAGSGPLRAMLDRSSAV